MVRELKDGLLVMFEPPAGDIKDGVGEGERMGSISVEVMVVEHVGSRLLNRDGDTDQCGANLKRSCAQNCLTTT